MINIILNMCKIALFIVRTPILIIKYSFIGLEYVLNFLFTEIFHLFKYVFIGFKFVLNINFEFFKYIFLGFIFLSNFVYKIFKYAFKGLLIPFVFFNILWAKGAPKRIEKRNKKIELKVKKQKEREKVQREKILKQEQLKLEKQNKKEEKIRLAEEKKQEKIKQKQQEKLAKIEKKKQVKEEKKRHKKKTEAYINEEEKLEKTGLLISLLSGSKNGVNKIKEWFNNKFVNNSFSKNIRNRRDMKREALLINFEGEDAVKSEKKILYQYVARNKEGKVVKDYFEAFSKVEVHSFLLSEGYTVYSIKTGKWIQFLHGSGSVNKTKFKNKDLIFLLTQLSTYVKAGIPLVESLRILARQYKKKEYQKIFRSVIYELTMGESFSSAMEKQNVAFPKLLINMVKTAEMTGELPEVLDDMAEYYTEAEATRKQMVTAMMYPSMVAVFAIGVMIFIMMYVVPQFVEIYDTMDGVEIPTITLVILGISNFFKNYFGYVAVGVIILILLLIYMYKKIRTFRTMVQWLLMHLPVFGNTVIYNEVTMFTKTFSSLLAHNVPITECMEVLNKITNNEIYKMLILDTISNLARGGKISDAFKDNWAFPVAAYEMIVTGEATGELAEMMAKVSDYYQELHKNSVTRIKTFIEPALTIFLAGGVGIIILSIILPMFNMYSAVQDMG